MIPLIGMEEAAAGKVFNEEGMPTGGPGWDEIEFPDFGQEKVFALEVTGDTLAPLYRDGDILIVSPTASIRKGDRIVVRTTNGEIMAKELKRRSAKTLEMTSLNPGPGDRASRQGGGRLDRPGHVGAAIGPALEPRARRLHALSGKPRARAAGRRRAPLR